MFVLHGGAFLQLLEEVLGEQSMFITVLCCPFLAVLNSEHPFPLFLLPFPPFPMNFFGFIRLPCVSFLFIFSLYSPCLWFLLSIPPCLIFPCLCSLFLCSLAHPVVPPPQQVPSQVPEPVPTAFGAVESSQPSGSTPGTTAPASKQGRFMEISSLIIFNTLFFPSFLVLVGIFLAGRPAGSRNRRGGTSLPPVEHFKCVAKAINWNLLMWNWLKIIVFNLLCPKRCFRAHRRMKLLSPKCHPPETSMLSGKQFSQRGFGSFG